jgi:hypothetical protein
MKTFNILMTFLGVFSIAPSSFAGFSATPTSSEGIDLLKLLEGKTYGNILSTQDYRYSSSIGEIKLIKGTPIANGIPLAAVSPFKDFTPATALKLAGVEVDPKDVLSSELKILTEISLRDLLAIDPTLRDIKAEMLGWVDQGGKSLGDIAKTALGNNPIPETVLKATNLGQLGNIANIPYGKFPGADKLAIGKFLGLPNIPIAKSITATLPTTSLPSGIHMVRIDKVRTQEKGDGVNPKIVTGSDQRPKAQWTSTDPVSVVEIRDSLITSKNNLVNGALMVDGSSQMIPGGNVPCPLQPTALAIPGTPLAVSVHDLNAQKGTARMQLNMRLEFMFGLRTSYFIPIPINATLTEKSKTTFLFPLEIPQPSSVTASRVPTQAGVATLADPTKLAIQSQSVPVLNIVNNPVAVNIANGNIGVAVKTNAINPASGI